MTKITNMVYSWVGQLPLMDLRQFDDRPPNYLDNLAVKSIDRFIQGWTGGKPGIYQHTFMLPKIHGDRTYKNTMNFVCHEDSSFTPQVIGVAIEVWRHDKPKWVPMYCPPPGIKRERTRDVAETKLQKLYEEKNVEEVYNILLAEKEYELMDLILKIDYQV